ncbi:hypothetical protein [Donghicola mangrovi]|nr:hypothetical protein [Donghicola mangrovi]
MLRTITLGTSVSIQGLYVRDLADGRILVRVDNREIAGRPATSN